jgi:hypothetical protein
MMERRARWGYRRKGWGREVRTDRGREYDGRRRVRWRIVANDGWGTVRGGRA